MKNPKSVLPEDVAQPIEQLRYARLLDWGTYAGLAILLLSFAAQLSGALAPHVPLERLPVLWTQRVGRYVVESQTAAGWGWLALLHRGDMLGLAGIAVLAGCSIVCLMAMVPLYLRRGERAFAAVCLAEVAVVVFAASGWLVGGH